MSTIKVTRSGGNVVNVSRTASNIVVNRVARTIQIDRGEKTAVTVTRIYPTVTVQRNSPVLQVTRAESIVSITRDGAPGPPGLTGPPGPPGPQGDPGEGIKIHHRHNQGPASTTWLIQHDLGYNPGGILVEDSGGTEHSGFSVDYIDSNNLILTFDFPFGGTADLS